MAIELQRVANYEILSLIGTGGMGRVYKAIDREQDRIIAIKVLRPEFMLDRKKRKADYLGRENKIVSALNHPNVIRIFKIIEEPDENKINQRYLLMEYIDGPNLRYFIKNHDWVLDEGIDYCIQICRGLDYIHQQGIVHRDIKPENFLVSRDAKMVKIADFGLSKWTKSWFLSSVKNRTGTPKYMSPEQIAGKDIDFRSDIFSFGLTMYELFTSEYPYEGIDRKIIMQQIRDPRIPMKRPSAVNSNIPRELDHIIMKCCRKKAGERYGAVTEIILDLNRARQSRI